MSFKKSILFWVDGVLNNTYNEKELYDSLELKTLDTIVSEGCVGQLLYSNNENQEKYTENELKELLGFNINETLTESLFKEKYMNLKIKFISNVEKELNIFENSVILKELNQEFFEKEIKECSEDMIIVHYQCKSNQLKERREHLVNLDSFLSNSILSPSIPNDYYLLNIIIGYNETTINVPLTEQQQSNITPQWFSQPPKSFNFLNSNIINPRMTSPLFTIEYNPTMTRKDYSCSFKESEFIKGSNGKILLIQHFREVAFKLGKVPKYGA
ncbi:hypothetical protein DICPUDRAFT_87495 [Dictyostelium purpureum]|uniref:Uncharacterized protein n=1 Tax=Dictyostelium purpureum TaxID=5786 RepID=F0ZII0_DICPU|nr:uncharacterized protein DICPUDRAFT_87495 [Dictyostelium purpureum]EGC36266.1 hypothetical protein DICPUDRAFT_87495 [Dictyostelium purpureum]|eukprot:XP_003287212.1 hypothetical protein DICPUDRAFT_87495 [Dictyostelium purpureum]